MEEVRTELLTAKQMLASNGSLKTLHDVYDQLGTVPQGFPQLMDCLKIAMTFGVTSAAAERSFSSLKRVKTYLRSTMTQERLNNLALLYIERELSTTLWESMDDVILTFAQKHKIPGFYCFNYLFMLWFITVYFVCDIKVISEIST